MSNAAKMSLEERLVQHIKDVGLGLLIEDEDAITALTQRAIDQALFQPRTRGDSWSRETIDSPAVAAAREIAKAAAEKIKEDFVARMMADPKIVEAFKQAFIASIPTLIFNSGHSFLSTILSNASATAINDLQIMLQNAQIYGQNGKPIGTNQ